MSLRVNRDWKKNYSANSVIHLFIIFNYIIDKLALICNGIGELFFYKEKKIVLALW